MYQPYEPVTRNGASTLGNTSLRVMRLNTNDSGDSTTFNGVTGLKSMFGVNKGDTLHLSVQAYYENPPVDDGFFAAADLLLSILSGGVGGATGTEAAALGTSNLNYNDLESTQLSKNGTVDDEVPRAYLNYMIFKEDMTYVTSGFLQISNSAHNSWETVEMEPVTIEENGFMMVYVSNETNAASVVDFDNLKIVHAKTPIVQADDYYPFGLTFNSFTRSYSEPQRYKYNGFEQQTEWDVYDYQARYYDPVIGRFLNVDPAADLMRRHSPYNYAFDNPMRFTDPDGMMPEDMVNLDEDEDFRPSWQKAKDGWKPGQGMWAKANNVSGTTTGVQGDCCGILKDLWNSYAGFWENLLGSENDDDFEEPKPPHKEEIPGGYMLTTTDGGGNGVTATVATESVEVIEDIRMNLPGVSSNLLERALAILNSSDPFSEFTKTSSGWSYTILENGNESLYIFQMGQHADGTFNTAIVRMNAPDSVTILTAGAEPSVDKYRRSKGEFPLKGEK